jgi:hypothetical protein
MFIAQVDEVDVYDKNGNQQEDINSLIEYVSDLCHYKHKPLPDNDDDNARYFHCVKLPNYGFTQHIVIVENNFNCIERSFPLYIEKRLNSISLDFQGPPPKV